MVGDLGWTVVRQDDAAFELTAKKPGNLLGGGATVVFRVEGPAGLPSSEWLVGRRRRRCQSLHRAVHSARLLNSGGQTHEDCMRRS